MPLVQNSRPIQATISLPALRHNLAAVRRQAGDAKIWAVVKANAYGHGIERVYEGLRGADGFACLDLSEAQLLRSLGWRAPILLLEGVFNPRDLELCSRLNLWHVVHNEAQIDWLAAHKTHVGQRIFLKLNSGMNRLGFLPSAYRAAFSRLSALPQVEEISHMTHFSDADTLSDAGDQQTALQAERFRVTTDHLEGEVSLSNSAAALRKLCSDDWVRVGIALYGSSVLPDSGLQAVMTLTSQIIGVQNLVAGDGVGYGSTFVATQPMRIGIVACGYADGYPRHASNQGCSAPVLVDGERTHTVGRISMDMLAVDLSHLPHSGWGSTVTLWGSGLAVDEVASSAGTIGYELLCAVAPRVPFTVQDE
jgi:alanine racemase